MKKTIFLILAFICVFVVSQAQICDNYVKTSIDKVKGTTTIASKSKIIVSDDGGKTGFGISFMITDHNENELAVFIQAVGASNCIDENSEILFLFDDGTRLTLLNDTKFNCDAEVIVLFGGNFGRMNELNELKSKKVQTMRVYTYKGFVQQDFTESHKNEFLTTINCLSNLLK